MKRCDELEAQLNQSKKDSEMLMQAVLQKAFEDEIGFNLKEVTSNLK